jgi:hypothetical protein
MRNFACTSCGNEVYFENVKCLRCKHALGFHPERHAIVALEPVGVGLYRGAGDQRPGQGVFAFCANHDHGVCNWLTAADNRSGHGFCVACVLNRTIPNLTESGSLPAWRELERAKKRLVYSLLRFGVPLDGARWGKGRLSFDFVRNATTGHLDGVITIDIAEADAVELDRQRQYFGEPYRSLLGHLRHESGHFYWMVLVEASGRLKEFRALFGDERQEYAKALKQHHDNGPPNGWQEKHVSAYASAHPWEDWAETWALYLHLVDAVDTAEAEGAKLRTAGLSLTDTGSPDSYDAYREASFSALMRRWIPLTIAMNSLSRSLGNPDFYPFVIPGAAYNKLAFIHRMMRDGPVQPQVSNEMGAKPAFRVK